MVIGAMGRYRPPRPQSSKYITPEGAARLREELERLWKIERPAVTRAVAEAAAQGDRSENAEYIYGKKQLAEIDRRVRFLRKRLDGMRIVAETPSDTAKVYFGAWFDLEDSSGRKRRFRLVGPDEADHAQDYISMDSPLGKSIMGKSLGEKFEHEAPQGPQRYIVTGVCYERAKKCPARRPGESQGET